MAAQTMQHLTFLGAAGSPLLCLLHTASYPRQKEVHWDKLVFAQYFPFSFC